MAFLILGFVAAIGTTGAVVTNPPFELLPAAITVLASALIGAIVVLGIPFVIIFTLMLLFIMVFGIRNKDASKTDETANQSTFSDSEDFDQKEEIIENSFDPYEILGVPANASPDQIKTSYRNQMKLYHPDRVEHLGDALRNLANHKTKEIQRAFETLTAQG